MKDVNDTLTRLFEFYGNSTFSSPSSQANMNIQVQPTSFSNCSGVERQKSLIREYKRIKMLSDSYKKSEFIKTKWGYGQSSI